VWVLRRSDCTFVVDTGFAKQAALRRRREWLRCPAESLRLLEVDPDKVTDVIVTHLHYDHAGNLDRLPRARFHLQDRDMAYATGRSHVSPDASQPVRSRKYPDDARPHLCR